MTTLRFIHPLQARVETTACENRYGIDTTILDSDPLCTFVDTPYDRSRYRSRREPESSVSWSEAITRLHQRIANAKRIEDGPELFDALRGEP